MQESMPNVERYMRWNDMIIWYKASTKYAKQEIYNTLKSKKFLMKEPNHKSYLEVNIQLYAIRNNLISNKCHKLIYIVNNATLFLLFNRANSVWFSCLFYVAMWANKYLSRNWNQNGFRYIDVKRY